MAAAGMYVYQQGVELGMFIDFTQNTYVQYYSYCEVKVYKRDVSCTVHLHTTYTHYSTWKGQTRGVLGKCRCLCCWQPLLVDLDQKVFKFLEDERSEGRLRDVTPEERVCLRDKM